jgi:ribosomal protein S18 acetylase RimI-like enzyme
MKLRKANESEIGQVADIYDLVRNGEFCVWSEHYPTGEHARADFEAGCLYVLTDGKELLGCASVEPVAEDDDLPFWRVCDGRHREVSRVAISPKHSGKGYARVMMEQLVAELKREQVSSVHLLAAKVNIPAVKTYKSLGFDFIGECYRYGADYYVCEMVL